MSDTGRPVTVSELRAEYVPGRALGIGAASPRLSWITTTERAGWMQAGYEIELDGVALGRVDGDASVFVAWPGAPLDVPRGAPRTCAGVGSRRVGVGRGVSRSTSRPVSCRPTTGRRAGSPRPTVAPTTRPDDLSTSGASSRFIPEAA